MEKDTDRGLPTAAIFEFYPREDPLEKQVKFTTWADNYIERSDDPVELVRRTDVAQLIEDKINQLRNMEAETRGQHNVRAAKINVLEKELLEEVAEK